MPTPRRDFLIAALAAASAAPLRALASTRFDPVLTARKLLAENRKRIAKDDVVALADFSAHSARPRFFIVDLTIGTATAHLVAHGRGSDPGHSGWLRSFSNEVGSNATSAGAYRTGAVYTGKYGRSMRLEGLDAENSNAVARAIVIHPAWYVGPDMLRAYGKLGRSEGCFALSAADLPTALERLGPGRLLFAGKLS
ncbi:MAG: murein L,D-transpeptidase catalytic domain family protein [Parvularculaceae bacterium]|nr:murein L,D-transpeptidase catalytic domain family protein [Parvularculaceae bacterium]